MNGQGWPRRRIGRTDVEVTVLGLGCATIGASRFDVPRQQAEAVVEAAWDEGVRYVDVAPFYGYGAAERRAGDALRGKRRDDWILSTKVGRLLRPCARPPAGPAGHARPMPFDAVYDYSYDGVMRSHEASLQRLGLDRIDMLLVHDIGRQTHGDANDGHRRQLQAGGWRALDELRASGAVRAIGVGVFERQACLDAMDWGRWDLFLLAGDYTLLAQQALGDLLPRCEREGVSVVIGSPFNAGILAGGPLWNYQTPPEDILSRARAIRATCADFRVSVAAAALQFPLAHPVVASVIPGPRTVQEMRENAQALRTPVPLQLWDALREQGLIDPAAPTPHTYRSS